MARPKNSFKFYLISAFFLSAMVFLSGLSIGFLANEFKQKNIAGDLDSMRQNLESAELELLLMDFLKDELGCDYFRQKSGEISMQAHELGLKVISYESNNGFLDDEYYSIKKRYVNLLAKNWLAVEKSKGICDLNYSTILYFYVNKEDCDNCAEQAAVLSGIKSIYNDDALIYAIDSSLDLESANILEAAYGIDSYPSIVINGQAYNGLIAFSQIREILG